MTKSKIKIAVIAPPFASVPPTKQGGTERIVDQTINGLIERGYDVTLFGVGRYKGKAKFIQIFKKPISEIKIDPEKVEASRLLRLETAYIASVSRKLTTSRFDIVFNHARGGYLFLPLTEFIETPIVTILHLPLFQEVADVFSEYKNPNLVTISNSQRKKFKINYLATVYNGTDTSEFKFNNNPKDYFLFMGALGEHKNPKDAILAIKKTKEKLIIAGGKKREPYFSKEIKPLIDNKQIKYVGEVSGKKRIHLFANAKGFLMPIKWDEPFGLVMIEAMACGTPVIAYPRGAVKEIVQNKKNGFIANNVQEITESINEINLINRRKCRETVEEKFSLDKMVSDYETIIKKLIKK